MLLINLFTLLLGDVFTGVNVFFCGFRWNVKAWLLFMLGVDERLFREWWGLGGVFSSGEEEEEREHELPSRSMSALTLDASGVAWTSRGGDGGDTVCIIVVDFEVAILCLLTACLLFWNHIWTAFSVIWQDSANSIRFSFDGAGHFSNSAWRIDSSWDEVLLLFRRASGALSILGSFLGKVSCECVMKANARLFFLRGRGDNNRLRCREWC